MAGFAAHAFRNEETVAPLPLRRIGRVTAEASLRACRLAEAERSGDSLASRTGENFVCTAVGSRFAGRFLPYPEFVLANDLAITFAAAMAG